MSFDLSQHDQGVRVEERLWNLHSLVPDDFQMEIGNREVYMLVLEKESLGGSARAFDMIDRTQSQSGLRSALLQFVLRTLELVLEEHAKSAKEGKDRLPYPFDVYLETVVESSEAAASHASVDGGVNIRETIAKRFYPQACASVDKSTAEERKSTDSKLLRGCENREVLQYRLWIVVNEHVSFPEKLEAVLKLAKAETAKRTSATTLAFDNKSLEKFRKVTGKDVTTSDFSISLILNSDEHWAVINSENAMLDAIAVYTNNLEYLNPNVRSQCLSAVQTLSNERNPAYLGGIFIAAQQFRLCDVRSDKSQTKWRNYCYTVKQGQVDRRYFKFPHPTRTLIVSPDFHSRKMIVRYLPDYQCFNAQRRLLHADLQKAQQTIANAPRFEKPSTAANDTLVAAGQRPSDGRANNDDDDDEYAGGASRIAERKEADENLADIERELNARNITLRLKPLTDNVTRNDREAIDALILQSRYVDPTVHVLRHAIDLARAGNVRMTTLHMLAKFFRQEMAALDDIESPATRCLLHTELQANGMRDYLQSCTSPLADIGANGRAINAFMHDAKMQQQNFFEPVKFFDENLSVFGHMMVREMMVMDQIYHTHSVHLLQFAIRVALFDAFRVAHALHFNVLITGPAEIGKSRALEHVEGRAIPGTVLTAQRRTAKSDSVDDDHNDVLEGYHETPRPLLVDPCQQRTLLGGNKSANSGSGEGKDSEVHDGFKAKITSCIVRTIENRSKADGSRERHTRISEQIMTHCCLSNIPKHTIADPILSRFYHTEITEYMRRDSTLGDKSLDEKNQPRSLKKSRIRADWEFRNLQALFFHTEKLIFEGVLTEPTLTTFSVYQPIFVRVMEDEFGIRVPIRSLIKMELVIRSLVIQRSHFMLYAAPTAPFRGANISIKHLLRIDPWLYDDSEIVFFVFEYLRNQYIDPYVDIVSRALRVYLATKASTPRLFERDRGNTNTGGKNHGGSRGPGNGTSYNTDKYVSQENAERSKVLNTETWKTVSAKNDAFDFNKIMIRQRLETLSVELASIVAQNENVRLTKDQIERSLGALSQQTVCDYPYVPNNDFRGVITDKEFPVERDRTQKKENHLAVSIDLQRALVFVHPSVLQLMRNDPIKTVIEKCCDSNMPRDKMLSGKLMEPDVPHMLNTFTPKPNPRVLHHVTNRSNFRPSAMCMVHQDIETEHVAAEEDVEKVARERMQQMMNNSTILQTMSVDEYSVKCRLEAINLPAAAATAFSFRHIRQQIATNDDNFVEKAARINYPDKEMIAESQTKQVDDIKFIIANLPRDEAKKFLNGRVSFVLSTAQNEIQKKELVDLMCDLGYDARISDALIQKWDKEREAREDLCAFVQTEERDVAEDLGRKMKKRYDDLLEADIKKTNNKGVAAVSHNDDNDEQDDDIIDPMVDY